MERSKSMIANMMVEVFKTNVQEPEQAWLLVQHLGEKFAEHKVNFDLDDCDKILRVEGEDINTEHIENFMRAHGYECETLN